MSMIKNDWMKRVALSLLFVLCTYGCVYAQCQALYQQGVTLMDKGSWRSAITKFNAAKECDSKLEADCNRQIKICREKLSSSNTPKTKTVEQEPKLIFTPGTVEFGAGVAGRSIDIVVSSTPEDWYIKEGKTSQWFKSVRLDSLLRVTCTAANTDAELRSGYIVVRNGKMERTIWIRQRGMVVFSCDKSNLTFNKKGDIIKIQLNTNVKANEPEHPDWLHVDCTPDNQVFITAPDNSKGDSRTGTILFTNNEDDKVIRIECTQEGASVGAKWLQKIRK